MIESNLFIIRLQLCNRRVWCNWNMGFVNNKQSFVCRWRIYLKDFIFALPTDREFYIDCIVADGATV